MKTIIKLLLPFIVIAGLVACKKDDNNPVQTPLTFTFNGQTESWNNIELTPAVVRNQSTINGTVYYQTTYNVVAKNLITNKYLRVYLGFDVTTDSLQVYNADRFYNYFGLGTNYFEYDDEEATDIITHQVAVQYNDGVSPWFSTSAPNQANSYFTITNKVQTTEDGKPALDFTANFKCQLKKLNDTTAAPIEVPEFKGKLILM